LKKNKKQGECDSAEIPSSMTANGIVGLWLVFVFFCGFVKSFLICVCLLQHLKKNGGCDSSKGKTSMGRMHWQI